MPSKRKKTSRSNTRHWLLLSLLAIIALSIIVGFLRYRRSLEAHDPSTGKDATIPPTEITMMELRICLPSTKRSGFVWTSHHVSVSQVDRAQVGAMAAGEWAREIGRLRDPKRTTPLTAVEHFFLDDHGIVYLDLNPSFISSFDLGTRSEMELLTSLLRTLEANVQGLRRLVLLSGGVPVDTWAGHLGLDYQSLPLVVKRQ